MVAFLQRRSRITVGVIALAASGLLAPTGAGAFDHLAISVQGDDPDIRAAVEAASLLFSAQDDPEADPRDVLAAARADYGRLVGALYAEGYYGGVVHILIDGREASGFSPFAAPERIGTVRVEVTPGPQFRFGTAQVTPLPAGTVVTEGFQTGEVAQSTTIIEAAGDGVSAWRDAGRAKAAVSGQSIVADHRDATLDARITLAPGPEVRFGQLVHTTPSAVRAERIARIAGLPSGTRFSPAELNETAERLRRTGAFSSVALTEADTLGPGDTMDVELALVDQKPRRFGFGVEFSSLEGAALSGYWMHRNLLGGAERLRIEAEIADIDGTIEGMDAVATARLDIPAAFGTDTDAYVALDGAYYDDPGQTLWQGGGEAGVHRYFSPQIEGEIGLAYHYAVTEDDLGERHFSFASVPASLTWDRRDSTLDPTTGTYLLTELEPFYEFSSASAGARGWVDARAYHGMADDRVVIAGRLQAGYVASGDAVDVPSEYLFFSGGGGTVRGFPYQSLGADLGGGDMIGGRAFLGASAEARVKVSDKIGLVGFADVGHIGAETFFDEGGGWQVGAGVGVRYDTGVGPIRLDAAMPVSGDGGGGVQFYLGIGQAF